MGGPSIPDRANSRRYAYDGEGRLCTVQNALGAGATGYLYDAEGRRVAKGTITASANPASQPPSCDLATNSFTPIQPYVLGQSGEPLTILYQDGAWLTNVYGAGRLLATLDPAGTHFHLGDPLGTRRMQTNVQGWPELDCTNLPYGDFVNCSVALNAPPTADDSTPLHFTAKERDPESGGLNGYNGNDYFGARYYGSGMGRFLSPDPGGFFASEPFDPQSWNLYSYAQDNPLANTDPDGYDCVYLNAAGTGIDRDYKGNITGMDSKSNSHECHSHGGYWVDGTVTSVTAYTGSNDVWLQGQVTNEAGYTTSTDAYYTQITAQNQSFFASLGFPNLSGTVDLIPLARQMRWHRCGPQIQSMSQSTAADRPEGGSQKI